MPYSFTQLFRNRYWPDLYSHIPILLLALLIGVLGGYGAVLFRFVIKAMQFIFYQSTEEFISFAHTIPPYLLIILPALGGLAVGLIIRFGAREAKGHGVPEVMEAVVLKEGRMRKRVALVKIFASAVCIGSGGSVGREGPIVQIGSGIGSTVGQYFKIHWKQQKTLVGCGAAAGIAATFNAPIAGVLFALEILLGEFGLASFSPVVLSSVMATTISRQYFGDFPAFIIPEHGIQSLWEFMIYPFLGLTAGLISLLFTTVLYKGEDLFDSLKIVPDYVRPALGGLILGFIFLRFPHVFGVGYGAINLALVNEMSALMMISLCGIKILATSVTIGSGGSGGIFAPSLFIGAMIGGFFGWCAGLLFPGIAASPGTYALIAMGAVVAGTTHAPITAIIIIFELTGDYKIILPLMMCCIISSLVASSLKKGSIYTIKLLRRGVDIRGGVEQNILRGLKVGEFVSKEIATIPEGATLDDIMEAFKEKNISYLHVMDENNHLTGIISFRDIRAILNEKALTPLIVAKDVASTGVVTITPSDNIQRALTIMSSRGISQLPVVSDEDPSQLVGCLRQKDVISAYDKEIIRKELEAG